MKRILKQKSPSSFVKWVRKNPSAHWGLFQGEVKQELADQLRQEQGYLCCYCEQRIGDGSSHIEHLRPKGSQYSKYTFDYQNLLSSCLDKNSCGKKKADWYSPAMVTPLDENCEERFYYRGDGAIIPAHSEDRHAQETIDRLNLNCDKLKTMRMQVYEVYHSIKKEVSRKEFVAWIEETLQYHSNGEYVEFWTTVKYVAEKA